MNKKYLAFITFSSLAVFAVVFYSLYSSISTPLLVPAPAPIVEQRAATSASTSPSPTPIATHEVTPRGLDVTFSVQDEQYRVSVSDGSTVLDAMRELSSSTNVTFSGREYPSLGFLVESINGKKNGDGYYWFLYVNGKSSDTGVSQTELNAGDRIEWKYEKSL